MPLLVALWLALVHALTLTPPVRPTAAAVGSIAAVVGETNAGRTTTADDARRAAGSTGTRAESRVGMEAAQSADETLRLAQPVRSLSVPRSTVPAAAGPPAAALGTMPRLPDAALGAAAVRARTLARSHETSARGDVLPYFATAPPLRG